MSRVIQDLTNKKFERLTVLEQTSRNRQGRMQWLCLCCCGKRTVVTGTSLVTGNTKSCGCFGVYRSRHNRKNHLISHNGRTQCLASWAEECGLNDRTLLSRLNLGWSIEKALTTPARKCKRRQ
jgi:hypothetical protein